MSVILLVADFVNLKVQVLGGLSDMSFVKGCLKPVWVLHNICSLAAFQMDSSFIGTLASR